MDNILIIGIVLLGLGAVLAAWRFYHMWFLGEFWNNTPTHTWITWGITSLMVGAALFLVWLIYLSEQCPDNCQKSGDAYAGGILFGAIICAAIGASTYASCLGCCQEDKTLRWDWGDDEKDIPPMDERSKASGIDMVCFFMGLAIVWSNMRLGTCPVSCGVAVIATPG